MAGVTPPGRHGRVGLKCQALCLTWRFHDSRQGEVGSESRSFWPLRSRLYTGEILSEFV